MEGNKIKDLFIQERYDDVIASLEEIFRKLFVEMLDFKKEDIKEEYHTLNYDNISLLAAEYYPRYRQDIINLTHAAYREENTYLDVINIMLSTYSYMLDTYKEDYEEEDFYFEDIE